MDYWWDGNYQCFDGMKTGHTSQAEGYNLVASATTSNNMHLISVVMGVLNLQGREIRK